MKKLLSVLLTLALMLCLFPTGMAESSDFIPQGKTGTGNDAYMGAPMDCFWVDASRQVEEYTKIVGFDLTVRWTAEGYYGGWADTKENPMGMILLTKGAHSPDEYVFDYSNGQTPQYDLSTGEICAFCTGRDGTFVASMAFQKATEVAADCGDTLTLHFEGTKALFSAGDSVMTVLSYLGEYEYLDIRWILGEPELSMDDSWEKAKTLRFPDIPTAAEDIQNGFNYVDITVPDTGAERYPVVLWIHGGGYITGNRKSCLLNNMKEYLLSQGFAFVSAEYTLTGTECAEDGSNLYTAAGMPRMLFDLKAAVRFLRANADTYHLDTRFIAAMGESAGAGLALLMGTSNGSPDHEELSMGNAGFSSDVQAVVSFCGPTDFTGKYLDATMMAYVGAAAYDGSIPREELERLAALWSPARLVNAESAPMYLAYSREDTTVVFSYAEEMADAARKVMDKSNVKKMFYTSGGHVDRGTFDTYQSYTSVAEWLQKQAAPFL